MRFVLCPLSLFAFIEYETRALARPQEVGFVRRLNHPVDSNGSRAGSDFA